MSEKCIKIDNHLECYAHENQLLAEHFLQTYFFDSFRYDAPKSKRQKVVELIISPKCNLGCKYCYIHRHKKEIFDENIFDEDLTIKNLKLFLQWTEKQEFNPGLEIFSGELFAQEVGFKVLETIYNHQKNLIPEHRIPSITIPTNFTFLNSDELTERVRDLKHKLESIGIQFFLSASFDGLYMEQNRPYTKNLDYNINIERDETYYDKVFKFCATEYCGLHPMLYSKDIDKWKQNFLWFQEKMAEHGVPWQDLYLLHVRNEEWTSENIQDLMDFVEFLFEWTWEQVDHDIDAFLHFMLKEHGFNIMTTAFNIISRGITCGIQSTLTIRLSDLMVYPCHRTGYEQYYCGQFVQDDDEVLKYKNINAELLITTYGVHKEALPNCYECPINKLCTGQCFGACHESNNNLFIPIPSVCLTSYAILVASIKGLLKTGTYNAYIRHLDQSLVDQIDYVKKELNI